jgi:hypothetical protein
MVQYADAVHDVKAVAREVEIVLTQRPVRGAGLHEILLGGDDGGSQVQPVQPPGDHRRTCTMRPPLPQPISSTRLPLMSSGVRA